MHRLVLISSARSAQPIPSPFGPALLGLTGAWGCSTRHRCWWPRRRPTTTPSPASFRPGPRSGGSACATCSREGPPLHSVFINAVYLEGGGFPRGSSQYSGASNVVGMGLEIGGHTDAPENFRMPMITTAWEFLFRFLSCIQEVSLYFYILCLRLKGSETLWCRAKRS